MRCPLARGSAINAERIATWLSRFRFYRAPPDDAAIQSWLGRFKAGDKDVAARILDVVEVKSEAEIQDGYRRALEQIEGWSADSANRSGQWVFVGFGRAGESGQSMLRVFREATGMSSTAFNDLFCSATDLPQRQLTARDTVVFVDDFSGTGRQVTQFWPMLSELIASDAKKYLILTAVTSHALEKITNETELKVYASRVLDSVDNTFHHTCIHFTENEKKAVETYCKRADKKNPRGFGGCGILFVLSHKTPNNTIPILHVNNTKWIGLFPRYLGPLRV
jgi:hypothetical protein